MLSVVFIILTNENTIFSITLSLEFQKKKNNPPTNYHNFDLIHKHLMIHSLRWCKNGSRQDSTIWSFIANYRLQVLANTFPKVSTKDVLVLNLTLIQLPDKSFYYEPNWAKKQQSEQRLKTWYLHSFTPLSPFCQLSAFLFFIKIYLFQWTAAVKTKL